MRNMKQTWQELEKTAAVTVDGLGQHLDEGIKEVVIGLWAQGIPTLASCEGHIDWGLATPWVDIGEDLSKELQGKIQGDAENTPEELFRKYPQLKSLRDRNIQTQERTFDLLSDYYKDRIPVNEQTRLILQIFGFYGIVRLTPQGEYIQEYREGPARNEFLSMFQGEMAAFGSWLKDRGGPRTK